MTETEQDESAAASEQPEVESQENQQEESKMVPLAALQAERKKRQELEAKAQLYQDYMLRSQSEPQQQEEEDPKALVEKRDLKETTAAAKRDILETLYQDMNPEAVQRINKYLPLVLEKKPWLAASVDSAQNRYARANEIVNDYLHLVEEKPKARSPILEGKKIVENFNKPGSPSQVGKSAQPGGMDYLKSIQGKKEFREYRQNLLKG